MLEKVEKNQTDILCYTKKTKTCSLCRRNRSVRFFSKRTLPSGNLSLKESCKECVNALGKFKTSLRYRDIKFDYIKGEKWKPILNYPGYFISSKGRVKSKGKKNRPFDKILTPQKTVHGYLAVNIRSKNIKRFAIHRLVAEAFIPNPRNKPCVNHLNNIKTDNRNENLEWVTHLENTLHIKKQGRFQLGVKRYNCRLTNKTVLAIFKSKMQQRYLALKYNVHQGTIAKIKTGQNWSHVTKKIYTANFKK